MERDRAREEALAEYDARRNATARRGAHGGGERRYADGGRGYGDAPGPRYGGDRRYGDGGGDRRYGDGGRGYHDGGGDRRYGDGGRGYRDGGGDRRYGDGGRRYGDGGGDRPEHGRGHGRPSRWEDAGAPDRRRGPADAQLLTADEEHEISEACRAGNGGFSEYRRLVREKLHEKCARCIWATSPSPEGSPARQEEPAAGREEEAAGAPPDARDGGRAPSLDALRKRARVSEAEDQREADLLRKFVAIRREQEEQIRLQKLAAVEAEAGPGPAPAVCPPCDAPAGAPNGGGGEGGGARGQVDDEEEDDVEDDGEVGPPKPQVSAVKAVEASGYGFALMPGEGEAMASFVKEGKRIPRRGEVGLTSEQIERYESLGFVMSGSRHNRMNAIRIRKENQVYSAEEKAALAMINHEEKEQREAKVMADLKRLVESSLKPPE